MELNKNYNKDQKALFEADAEIFNLILKEEDRQKSKLEMIASENFASRAVLETASSVFTNKYAEGYPYKRYYGGCEVIDEIESIAIERARQLFSAEYANVQPHCGSSANLVIYSAFLKPGDCIMGMDLAHGGHLSHGAKVSITGKLYKAVHYGVNKETELLNYDEILKEAQRQRPKLIIAGASAYSHIIDFEKFSQIAEEVGALLLVDMAHISGLVAADLHPSPVPHADFVTSTTHKTLRGPRGGLILLGKNKDFMMKELEKTKKYSVLINSANMPGLQGGPLMHIIAAKAVAFKEAMSPEFREYQKQVVKNASVFADTLMKKNIRVVGNGTRNHIVLIDVKSSFDINGKEAEQWLDKANITANKNGIPFDQESPLVCSGVRFGMPAITTRGMKEQEIELIAEYVVEVLTSMGNEKRISAIGEKVLQLSKNFPMYVKVA